MTVRVGHIGFLNCYPLYHGLQRRGVLAQGRSLDRAGRPGIEFFPGVPTDLNRMLLAGEIDLGPISSIAYARDHRRLLVSRHVSISSLGAVDSIQLVTRRPLEQVGRVSLTRQSATAVALLKTIFKLYLRRHVEYRQLEGPVSGALEQGDAVLLIGDEGLDALYFPLPGTTCHDLGAIWQEWTGLPMVYAVWATREDYARENGADVLAAEAELVACMDYGREHLTEVVEAALSSYHYDRPGLTRYFALLHYGFAQEYQRGLLRFYELAHQAGELDEVPRLRFIDEYADVAARPQRSTAAPSAEGPEVGAGRAAAPPAAVPATASAAAPATASQDVGGREAS
jgi:chorismate dehydratase